MTTPKQIPDILERHPAVTSVRLAGSRARDDAFPLSDWDFVVEVSDLQRVVGDLPALVERMHALAHQWDPLSDRWNYMIMLPGPVKVDIIIEQPHEPQPAWVPSAGTLAAIDHHLWDWTLWLATKRERGLIDLVTAELRKMFEHLLNPLGVDRVPTTIEEAIRSYVDARDAFESRTGAHVDRRLADEVMEALRRA